MFSTKRTIIIVIVSTMLVLLTGITLGDEIYVDPNAIGDNDGTSWFHAYNSLIDALADANTLDIPVDIYVVQGTYRPDQGEGITPGDRNATFQLINGVTLYGGFPPGGGTWEDRDPNKYETVLSGDLLDNDQNVLNLAEALIETSLEDNSIHVVTGSGTNTTAILDGFIITGGCALGVSSWVWAYDGAAEWDWYDYLYNWEEFHLYGAGMFNNAGSPTVTNCKFTRNAAVYGGGMNNLDESAPTVSSCTFEGNVSVWGAGIQNALASNPTLNSCAFTNNVAGTNNLLGLGAGFISVVNCKPTLFDCTFTGNYTVLHDLGDNGGAINEHWGGNALIENCTFVGNSSWLGGAISVGFGNHTIRDCVFTGNSCRLGGGAVYSELDELTLIEDCFFEYNESGKWGGAISSWSTVVRLFDCDFKSNTAIEWGGAVLNWRGSDFDLNNCLFSQNSAQYSGAIGCQDGKQTISNCIFTDNTATVDSGAVDSVSSDSVFTNCLFDRNISPQGGALWTGNNPSKKGNSTLTNCTIIDNSTYAIWVYNNKAILKNCIVWGNTPGQINGLAEVFFSDIEGGWEGEGNIEIDPLFIDPDNGDYHLQSQVGRWDKFTQNWIQDAVTSPCIDGGDPEDGIAQEPQPHGGRINLGAYGGTLEASKSLAGYIPGCINPPTMDANDDCKVDLADFAEFAAQWLTCGLDIQEACWDEL